MFKRIKNVVMRLRHAMGWDVVNIDGQFFRKVDGRLEPFTAEEQEEAHDWWATR